MAISEGPAPAASGDRTPLLMLVGLATGATLLFLTLKLGSEILEGEGTGLDRALMLALRVPGHPEMPIGPAWLRRAMLGITNFGGGIQLTALVAFAAGLLIIRGARRIALLLVLATSSGGILVALLKSQFARPRPALVDHLVQVQSASFPSGHAANSAMVFLTLGALLMRVETTHAERLYTFSVAIVLTIAVGISRVYLGVHWPSDVAGGWMLGAGWALLWWILAAATSRN